MKMNWTHIIIHTSATKRGNAAIIRRYHMDELHWSDIGYNYVIGNGTDSGDGQIEVGRPLDRPGAHCIGYNDKAIGICLVGDHDHVPLTNKQYSALRRLIDRLKVEYHIPTQNILGHRETESGKAQGKTCPGLQVSMEGIRSHFA